MVIVSEVHRTRRWATIRQLAKRRDGFRCVKCGGRARLEVAHILSAKARPDLAFDLNNVRTLDWRCHIEETRAERSGEIDPTRQAWRELVRQTSSPNGDEVRQLPLKKDVQCLSQ